MLRTQLLWLNAFGIVLGFGALWFGINTQRSTATLIGIGVMIACGGLFWLNLRDD